MSIETLTQPPVVNGSLTTEKMEQAWNEIYATFLDDMLNLEQKKIFVMAILKGQLANPPVVEAKPQGEATTPYKLINALRDFLRTGVVTLAGGRAFYMESKVYYNLLELADEAGSCMSARVQPEATPSKQENLLHDKILALKDNMEKSFTSVEHLLEPDKNEILAAAKGLIEWFKSNPKSKAGSGMRLVKAIRETIEVQEKEGINHAR